MSLSPKAIYDWYRQMLRNPKYRWWIIVGTLAYLLSPLDVSPDFLPIAGQLDDVILVSLLISELSQMAMDFFQRRQQQANPVKTNDKTTAQDATTVEVNAVAGED